MALSINYDDPLLYEHLSYIINEFEKVALHSGERNGIIAVAQNSLSAMDMILESSDKALTMGKKSISSSSSNDSTDSWIESENSLKLSSDYSSEKNEGDVFAKPSYEVGTEGKVSFDADFTELFGGEGDPNKRGDTFGDYLKNCLSCDLRLKYSWQLQPVDLLSPIGNLLDGINASLDQFEGFLNPDALMANICLLMNGLNVFCIPDLITILSALKMQLKNYLTSQFNIQLDWTVLLGPILKLILDGISTMLSQISGVMLAPLNCAVGALTTLSKLQDTLSETAQIANAVNARLDNRVKAVAGKEKLEDNKMTSGVRYKDVSVTSSLVDAKNDAMDVNVPSLKVSDRVDYSNSTVGDTAAEGTDFSFVTGFQFDSTTTLPEALEDKNFLKSNPFAQLSVSVNDARMYISNLVLQITTALRSLEKLTSGSLSLNLKSLGIILYLRDMIRIVLIIIKLFTQYKNVKDWCEFLSDNPEVTESFFPGATAKTLKNASGAVEKIVLRNGPRVVAEIHTCLNSRTEAQNMLMAKWISELKDAGTI